MLSQSNVLDTMTTPARQIEGRAYVYNAGGSTAHTFRHNDYLKSFIIERIGASGKFFGFGVATKATVNIVDKNRAISLDNTQTIRPFYIDRSGGTGVSYFPYPKLNIEEVERNENTNELKIVAYDVLNSAAKYTVTELDLVAPYNIGTVISAIVTLLGLSGVTYENFSGAAFVSALSYENGANFDGTETIREVLDFIAEVTQTIYFIDRYNKLIFKRLKTSADADLNISKSDYFTLTAQDVKTLTTIVSANDLGDNLSATTGEDGATQYIKNNAFWELRDDIETLLTNAVTAVGGTAITVFDCEWRGNTLLEIGDKISVATKDDGLIYAYYLNSTITYNGGLKDKISWSYEESAATHNNPITIGEIIKETYAKVDKANKRIEIVAGETAQLTLEQDKIASRVGATETELEDYKESSSEDIAKLYSSIEQTKSDLKIAFTEEIANIDGVTTSTGYKFDKDGLEITKSGAKTATKINEDGMTVSRDGAEVLTADNTGVNAENLHATTYLIIGTNSRFEDYGTNRTGCFWIGQ